MVSQVNEVQQIRREAETVDSNSAELFVIHNKLFEIFELVREEQGEISSK